MTSNKYRKYCLSDNLSSRWETIIFKETYHYLFSNFHLLLSWARAKSPKSSSQLSVLYISTVIFKNALPATGATSLVFLQYLQLKMYFPLSPLICKKTRSLVVTVWPVWFRGRPTSLSERRSLDGFMKAVAAADPPLRLPLSQAGFFLSRA